MPQMFESNGRVYDVEIFQCGDTDIVRFYEKRNEQYGEMLSDLVIGTPSYGFLLIQHIAGDAFKHLWHFLVLPYMVYFRFIVSFHLWNLYLAPKQSHLQYHNAAPRRYAAGFSC